MSGPARRLPRTRSLMILSLSLGLLTACAGGPPERVTQTQDPWEGFNRKIYAFNDALDKHVARPVAKTYVRAMPAPAPSLDAGRGVPAPGLAQRSARPGRYRHGHVAASSSAARSACGRPPPFRAT